MISVGLPILGKLKMNWKVLFMRFYWDVILFWDEVERGVYLREPFWTSMAIFALCPIYWYLL